MNGLSPRLERPQIMGPLLDERRIVSRILLHWHELVGARPLPRRADVDRLLLAEDWPHCVVIALGATLEQATFARVGAQLAPAGQALAGAPLAACPGNTLLASTIAPLARVLEAGKPVTRGGPALHLGTPILFRAVLMPLSEDGRRIDHVFGAANCREISSGSSEHSN